MKDLAEVMDNIRCSGIEEDCWQAADIIRAYRSKLMGDKMYLIEARKNTETFIEVFPNLEEATEVLKELLNEGYEATIIFP